jgi:hypothetical protein
MPDLELRGAESSEGQARCRPWHITWICVCQSVLISFKFSALFADHCPASAGRRRVRGSGHVVRGASRGSCVRGAFLGASALTPAQISPAVPEQAPQLGPWPRGCRIVSAVSGQAQAPARHGRRYSHPLVSPRVSTALSANWYSLDTARTGTNACVVFVVTTRTHVLPLSVVSNS